jgi:hypothetical protein
MIKITTFVGIWTGDYTVDMSMLPSVTPPTVPKTVNVKSVAIFYACILTVFALAQLFSFDDFLGLIESFWLPGGAPAAYFLAAFIVIAEVFTLPFLLQMRVSGMFRFVSMVLGWVVPAIWLILCIWLLSTTNAVDNIGFLGTVVMLAPGWWAVLFSLALGVLAMWTSWGMWPKIRTKEK